VNQFKREQAGLLSTDPDVAAAYGELEGDVRQKVPNILEGGDKEV
jgi:hypothetical protein